MISLNDRLHQALGIAHVQQLIQLNVMGHWMFDKDFIALGGGHT
jgi:hypothetical protein